MMDLQFDNSLPGINGEYNLIDRAAPHWRTVLDVGANRGEWTARVLAANPSCMVDCVEPSPTVHAGLAVRFAELPNVRTHQFAVSDAFGRATLYEHEAPELSNILDRPGYVYQSTVEVATKPLDGWLHDDIVDFMKVDTEGCELAVFRGGRVAIESQRIRAVQFEYGGTWSRHVTWPETGGNVTELCAWLRRVGWSCYLIQPECVVWMSNAEDHGHYCNILAVSDEQLIARWGLEVVRP